MDEIKYLKEHIAFQVIQMALTRDSMCESERLLDILSDEEDLLITRETIHLQERILRETMEDLRATAARIKRLEILSRDRQSNIQPRTNPGTRNQEPTPIQSQMLPSFPKHSP